MYDLTLSWNRDVQGEQILSIINDDYSVLRVAAGPGTGKTFALRRRVLRLLHSDGLNCQPREVLVCAFNRVIARDLEKQIEQEVHVFGLGLPVIKTIHSLCAAMVGVQGTILLPQEVEAMLYDVREEHPDLARKYGRFGRMKRALELHQAGLRSYPDLRARVDQWLADHNATLVGDLPRQVERGLAQGQFLEHKYNHVIVDEFQDLTETEARIAVGLVAAGGSLVVLGDRKQSIYHFRGNARGGLQDIERLVSGTVTDRTMNECRRCPDQIVRLSNAVVEHYSEPLVATGERQGQIHSIRFSVPNKEAEGLAREIVRVYKQQPNAEHLVMVTRRKWGYDLRRKIREIDAEVPVHTVFAEDVLQTWSARDAFLKFAALSNANAALTLRDWVSYQQPDSSGRGFKAPARNAAAYKSIKDTYGVLKPSLVQRILQNPATVEGQGKGKLLSRLEALRHVLEEYKNVDDAEELIESILNPNAVSHSSDEALAREDILRLRNEALGILREQDASDRSVLKAVVDGLRHRIAMRESLGEEEAEKEGVKIVTLWGGKGLTADFVYIMGIVDEALPGFVDPDAEQEPGEHLEEQRRLFYVSLTRAKEALVLSRPDKIRVGDLAALKLRTPRSIRGYWAYFTACRFLRDLPAGFVPDAVEGESWKGITF